MSSKTQMKTVVLLTIFLVSMPISNTSGLLQNKASIPYVFSIKTNAGGIYPDYGLSIASYLSDIGIDPEVKVVEWTIFTKTLDLTHDYDMGIKTFDFSFLDPDPTSDFSADGTSNPFLLELAIPYAEQSERMLKQTQTISDPSLRFQTYVEWSNLVMDKIVPIFPLFNQQLRMYLWSNTFGYENLWGLADSLPYMYFNGYHNGQVSLDEFNFALPKWITLNALKCTDSVSDKLISLITEPMLQMNPNTRLPLNTGLINSWDILNDTHFAFHLRDNVYWSPSYNITDRTPSSLPLNASDASSHMIGLKGEYSDGTNQKLTAKDIVFSLLAYGNPLVSESWHEYRWIKSLELDPVDELTFNMVVDGNPTTAELEYYAPLWSKLKQSCLPEFFLNSTSLNVTQSSSGLEMIGLYDGIDETDEWKSFSNSAFGCGKYQLNYTIHDERTVFHSNPNWINVGAFDGTIQHLNISTINVEIMGDSREREAEFKAGKLDICKPEFPFDYAPDPWFTFQSSISNEVSCLFFNLQRPFFGGFDNYVNCTSEGLEEYSEAVAVRKAVCYSIDREHINEELNHQLYTLQHGLINDIFTQSHSDEIFEYYYDIHTSLDWLEAGGYNVSRYRPTTTPTIITTISYGFSFLFGILASSVIVLGKIRKRVH